MKKTNSKKSSKEDNWINVHDDDVVRSHGIWRPYIQTLRDFNVWTKTSNEKRILKNLRHNSKKDMHFGTIPRKLSRFRSKLIINLNKNKYFNKTTYSIECWEHEIPEILNKYKITNNNGNSINLVRKYFWNGKTYTLA